MNLRSIGVIAIASIGVLAGAAQAGPWTNTRVTQVLVTSTSSGDRVYVIFETPLGSDGCSDPVSFYAIKPDTAQGKNFLALAMMAKATGSPVSAFTDGCDDIGRNVLGGLWVTE